MLENPFFVSHTILDLFRLIGGCLGKMKILFLPQLLLMAGAKRMKALCDQEIEHENQKIIKLFTLQKLTHIPFDGDVNSSGPRSALMHSNFSKTF